MKRIKENCGLHLGVTHFSVVKMKNNVISDVIVLPHEKLESLALKSVATALSDEIVIAKILKFNGQLSENEIEKHLNLESKHYFGYDVRDLYFDFKILHHDPIKKLTLTYVVGSRRKDILEKINYLKNFNIRINVIDIESLAIARAVQFFRKEKFINYFYFDANQMLFTVLNQKIIYSRFTKLTAPIVDINGLIKLLNQNLDVYLNLDYRLIIDEIILISDHFSEHIWLADKSLNIMPLQLFMQKNHPDLLQKNNLTQFITALGLALWK